MRRGKVFVDHIALWSAQADVYDPAACEGAHGGVSKMRACDEKAGQCRIALAQLNRKGGASGGRERLKIVQEGDFGVSVGRLAAARHPLQQLVCILAVDAVKGHKSKPHVLQEHLDAFALAASRRPPHHQGQMRRGAHVRRHVHPRVAISQTTER